MRPSDRVIARLAGRQLGLVTRAQLLTAGISSRRIQRRLQAGRLHAVHRGVYAVGHPVLIPRARELAAVLACGSGAVLSHRSAGALWELIRPPTGPVEVVRDGSHGRGPAGVRLRETRALPALEVGRHHGVPVTSPARTLLDLATVIDAGDLERAVGEAQARRLVRVTELNAIARGPRRGSVALRAVLDDPPSLTRSAAERRLLGLVARARLPRPQTNVRLGGYEVDAFWPAQRLVVEVDGYAFHSGRGAFERDRMRDAKLLSAGLRVLRVTWRQLVASPEEIAARLGATLAERTRH